MKLVINLKDATDLYNEDPITLTIPLDKQKPEENEGGTEDVKSLTELFVRVLNTGADITLQSIDNQSEFVVFRPQDGLFFLREGIIDQTPEDYLLQVYNDSFALIPVANVDDGTYTVKTSIVPFDSDIAHVALLDLTTNEVKHYTGFTQHKEETVDLELDFESLTSHFLDVIKSGTDITLQNNSEVLTFTYQNDLPFLRKINPDGTFTDYLLMQYDETFGVISSNENGETKVETVIIPTDSSEADIAIYDINTKELKHYFGYTGHRVEEPTLEELGVLTNEFVSRLKSGEDLNLTSKDDSNETMMFSYQPDDGGILLVKGVEETVKTYLVHQQDQVLALVPLSDIIDDNIVVETFIVPIKSEEADIAFLDMKTYEFKHYNGYERIDTPIDTEPEEIFGYNLTDHFIEVLNNGEIISLQSIDDQTQGLEFSTKDGHIFLREGTINETPKEYLLIERDKTLVLVSLENYNPENPTIIKAIIPLSSDIADVAIYDITTKEIKQYTGYNGYRDQSEENVVEDLEKIGLLTNEFINTLKSGTDINLTSIENTGEKLSFTYQPDDGGLLLVKESNGEFKSYIVHPENGLLGLVPISEVIEDNIVVETFIIPMKSEEADIAIFDLNSNTFTHYNGYNNQVQDNEESLEDLGVLTNEFVERLMSGENINLTQKDNINETMMFSYQPDDGGLLLVKGLGETVKSYLVSVHENTLALSPLLDIIDDSVTVETFIVPIRSEEADIAFLDMKTYEFKHYNEYKISEETEEPEVIEIEVAPLTSHFTEVMDRGEYIQLQKVPEQQTMVVFEKHEDRYFMRVGDMSGQNPTDYLLISDGIKFDVYKSGGEGNSPILETAIIPTYSEVAQIDILDLTTGVREHYIGYTGHLNQEGENNNNEEEETPSIDEENCEDCQVDCVECVEDYTTPLTQHFIETLNSGIGINLRELNNEKEVMMFSYQDGMTVLVSGTLTEDESDITNVKTYMIFPVSDENMSALALLSLEKLYLGDMNPEEFITPYNSQEADISFTYAFTGEVKHYTGYTGHKPTNCCTPTEDCEDGSCYENRCEICGRFNCDKGEDCVPYLCGICGEKGIGCYDGYCKSVDWNYSTSFSTAYGGSGGGDVYTCTKCGKDDGTCSPSQCGTYSCLFCEEEGCVNGSICLGDDFQGAMEFSKSGFNGLTPEITAQNPEIDTVTGKSTGRVYPIFADHWLQATGETQGGVEFREMTKEEINAALRETDHRNTWPYFNEEGQYDKNLPYAVLPEFDTTGRKTLEDGTVVETIGQLTKQAHDSGLGRINLFRKMMGAPGVYLDPGMSKSAQAGAFLLGKHGGKIQHGISNPGMDTDLYNSGNGAIKNGLLASYPFPYSVDNWMQDPGQMWSKSDGTAYQASPGHRVYMTAPVAAKFGYGYTTVNDWDFSKVPADQLFSPQPHGVSSLKGCDCSGIKAGFEFVSWPAPGFCPLGPWPKTHRLMMEDWPRPIWTSPWSVHFLSLSTNFKVKLYKINKETDQPERAWIANFNGAAENMFGRLENGVVHEGVDSVTGLTCEPFCAVVEEGPGSSYINRVVSFYPMSEGHQYEDGDIYEVIIEYGGFRSGGEPMKRVKFRTEFFTPDFI